MRLFIAGFSFIILNGFREYLTGFRKRKQAKKEASKAKAREREHQAKLEERREVIISPF